MRIYKNIGCIARFLVDSDADTDVANRSRYHRYRTTCYTTQDTTPPVLQEARSFKLRLARYDKKGLGRNHFFTPRVKTNDAIVCQQKKLF